LNQYWDRYLDFESIADYLLVLVEGAVYGTQEGCGDDSRAENMRS